MQRRSSPFNPAGFVDVAQQAVGKAVHQHFIQPVRILQEGFAQPIRVYADARAVGGYALLRGVRNGFQFLQRARQKGTAPADSIPGKRKRLPHQFPILHGCASLPFV